MHKTLAEIADIVGGEVVGDKDLIITRLSGLKEAEAGDLTFVANSKYIPLTKETKASAVITPRDMEIPGKSIIRTDNPSLAFANIASYIAQADTDCIKGIHEKAVIGENVVLGQNVTVGPCAVIENNCKIGDNTMVYGNVYIRNNTTIGADCLIYPNVTIREHITIGDRVIIHSSSVIGADGFGYESVNGKHIKIPQLGTVVIEDDVEIGSAVTVDRARFDKTIIGKGTKIDNLVQVAHNVRIGENCIIISQVGISGSSVIEDNSILAGQVGLAGHITIGANSIVGSSATVLKSIPPNSKVIGYPARPFAKSQRSMAAVNRLPKYIKIIYDLQKRIEDLEKKVNDGS